MRLCKLLLVVVFAIFLSKAFFVTVIMREYYFAKAKENRVKAEVVLAPRGVIADRSGKIIATNILTDEGKTVRFYPDGEVVAGVVGYMNSDGGVAGLEKQYQEDLKGIDGERVLEETASGKEVKEVSLVPAEPGKRLDLNLDLGLQTAAYRALKKRLATAGKPADSAGKAGAVVVSRVDGAVLALVSLPSYDPNLFVPSGKRGREGGIYTDAKGVVTDEVKKPLFDRAIAGSFPPGSIFKLIPALAGLNDGVITSKELIEDSGEIIIGQYRFGNWFFDKYGKTEGQINVVTALARSNDIFFYRLGERMGVDSLVSWSKKFGLGEKTGIDLPGEKNGLLPTPLWMEKEKGERWFLGDTYHLAIGQGDLTVTPLQINRAVSGVVSGKMCSPRLFGKSECRDLNLSEKARLTVMEGMEKACLPGGTGTAFFDLKEKVFCKTGTAQHGGDKTKPHAWMTVVMPNEDLVITVLLDEAGEGSEQAGPVAREIVDYLLQS